MGGDSCSEGRGFESHLFVEKLYCLLEKDGNKQKRGRCGPFQSLLGYIELT